MRKLLFKEYIRDDARRHFYFCKGHSGFEDYIRIEYEYYMDHSGTSVFTWATLDYEDPIMIECSAIDGYITSLQKVKKILPLI